MGCSKGDRDSTTETIKSPEMINSEVGLLSEKLTEEPRGQWTNQFEFILSSLGYAVGLGNIWRFPYLCMRNGGGAFLIPYFLALFLCGMPLFLLEITIGQFSGLSPLQVWKLCPLMKGLGFSMLLITSIISTYYNVINGWTLYYLIKSFAKTLPWSTCGNPWNTPYCLERGLANELTPIYNESADFEKNISYSGIQQTSVLCTEDACNWNNTTLHTDLDRAHDLVTIQQNVQWRTPAEEFWNYKVLDISEGVEDVGGIKWDIFGILLLAWVIIFFCLCRGIKTSGKVVYVTATIPYLFITALLIRGVTLPGAIDGIKYYIIPDWSKLLELQVWVEAMLQILYTLGPGWGALITMSSYNKFTNNCVRDGVLIPLITCLTSFYGGFVIFSVLGFMAKRANVPVKDVVSSGPGLSFIVYPEAVSHMPISPMWAVCFFCMLLSVGLDSMFSTTETIISSTIDEYPALLRRYKTLFTAGVCVVFFLLGIPFVTRGGIYAFQLLDWYIVIPLLFIFFFEYITLSWIYGTNRICKDLEIMTGSMPSVLWKICWAAISPALLLVVTVYSFVGFKAPAYGDYEYPLWVLLIGWAVSLCPAMVIPICSIHTLVTENGTFMERLKASLKPHAEWGPSDPTMRMKYNCQNKEKLSSSKEASLPLKIIV